MHKLSDHDRAWRGMQPHDVSSKPRHVSEQQQGLRSDVFADAVVGTDSAMNVDRNGRTVPALFMTKICYSEELAISHTGTQSQELQRHKQDWSSTSRTICGSATTAIIEADGIGLRVRIAASHAATSSVNSFCNAAIACFRLVYGADVTVCDQIDSLTRV